MYKSEFDKIKDIKKSYLFWGEEDYYIQKYSSITASKISEQKMVLYFEEYDFETAKNYLSQASLFGDTNLLIIKTEKPIALNELKKLIQITKKAQNSYLIVELYSVDGKKIAKEFDIDVRFFKPKDFEALNELKKEAKELKIQIDEGALKHLLLITENNLSFAISELKKLSIYKKVDIKEIDKLVYAINPLNIEELFNFLIEKKPLSKLFKKIEMQEINEIRVLLGIENLFLQLFKFYSYIRLNGKCDSKEILGYKLPRHIEEQRSRQAIKIKNYPDIFMTLTECEYKLKKESHIDKKAILFSYLIKLQGLI